MQVLSYKVIPSRQRWRARRARIAGNTEVHTAGSRRKRGGGIRTGGLEGPKRGGLKPWVWAGSSEIGLYVGADTAPSHPVRRRDFPRTSVWKLGTTLLTEEFVHLAPLVHGSPPFADTPVQRLTPITDATQRQFGRRRGRPRTREGTEL